MIAISEQGSFNKASEVLYISQPSLTEAVRELEKELGITIFYRSGKGVTLTGNGVEFISYARELYRQYEVISERYGDNTALKKKFAVSTQHYSFAVKSFVELVKQLSTDEYEFAIREVRTQKVIDDVSTLKSEIGILYLSDFNSPILTKLLRTNKLMYFDEEILSNHQYPRTIKATDRATMLNLMVGLNGYTLCSGIICEELNGSDFAAIPFEPDSEHPGSKMKIGYITKKNIHLSRVGKMYIEELKKYLGVQDGDN